MGPVGQERATRAATAIATDLGLPADDAVLLQDANRVTLRLRPAEVVARVSVGGLAVAEREVALARALAEVGPDTPVARLDPRVAPGPHEHDGCVVTLWAYHEPIRAPSAAEVADALHRLHAAMRSIDVPVQHVTDRVAEAQLLVADTALTPALGIDDRALLVAALRDLTGAIRDRGAPEQVLHGEPHPGNVLATAEGLRFIDLETCCRGPIEMDLAYAPVAVSDRYPGADADLLGVCRGLVLAVVAAWRWDATDHFPQAPTAGRDLVGALRAGPPWPSLDALIP